MSFSAARPSLAREPAHHRHAHHRCHAHRRRHAHRPRRAGMSFLQAAAGCCNNRRAADSGLNFRTKAGKKGGPGCLRAALTTPALPWAHPSCPNPSKLPLSHPATCWGGGADWGAQASGNPSKKVLILVWRKKKRSSCQLACDFWSLACYLVVGELGTLRHFPRSWIVPSASLQRAGSRPRPHSSGLCSEQGQR